MPESPAPDNAYNLLERRVLPECSGQRLDSFLARELSGHGLSRSRIKDLILQGHARIDGLPVNLPRQELISGQIVGLAVPSPAETALEAQEGRLAIIYQEENFLILNKPPGLTVHPCPSCPRDTLVNILIHNFPELGKIPGLRPGIVHRLDKDTSGLLLVALNETSRLKLSQAFAERMVSKQYLALVKGVPAEPSGIINQPIGRHPTNKTKMGVVPGGKEAVSEYRVMAEGKDFSLLAIKIHTGRTHQIRVHLAHIGHPIWGDTVYGGPCCRTRQGKKPGPKIASRQMLHAWKLGFQHPDNGEPLNFVCQLPEDFKTAIEKLQTAPLEAVITGLPGCGKSSLLKELGKRNFPVWSADAEVNKLYANGADGWQLIKGRFGTQYLDVAGNIDKSALFSAMQTEPNLHREIEEMIHPMVRHRLAVFRQENEDKDPQPCCTVAEVPLFLEAGWEKEAFDWGDWWQKTVASGTTDNIEANPAARPGETVLIYVDTPQEIRYQRLARKGVDEKNAAILDSWQLPENKKKDASDIIVYNHKGLAELESAAASLSNWLAQLSENRRKRAMQMIMDKLAS